MKKRSILGTDFIFTHCSYLFLVMIILAIFIMFSVAFAQSQNVRLVENVNDHAGMSYCDVWGFTAPNGDEYALLGMNGGVSIIDISDTSSIEEVDYISWVTADPFGSYDIKTYRNYMYVSSEGSDNILIVDLSELPESASVIGTYEGLSSTPHNIYIDTTQALLFVVEDFNWDPSVRILSLSDPENPVELSTINTGIGGMDAHDLHAQNSILYIAEGIDPSIGFYDISDPSNPSLITRLSIPAAGYVHQLWVSEDNKYMVTTEETPNKTVKIWDIQDMDNIEMFAEYLGENRIAHNAYIHDNKIYIAHYESGLKVLDLSNPPDLNEIGFFDTNPSSEIAGLEGAWGVYPFLDSELILVSDMITGLYVLKFEPEEGPQIGANDIDFGNVKLGSTSKPFVLKIKNYGTADLTITSISDPGEHFTFSDMPDVPFNIAAYGSRSITSVFSPPDSGVFDGTITIASNDGNDPSIEVSLTGKGVLIRNAQKGVIYGSIGNNEQNAGSLIRIDASTGTGTLIGPISLSDALAEGVPALAINSKGEIYASDISTSSVLYQVDAETGDAVAVSSTGIFVLSALCFDKDDVLYATERNGNLYTIDVSTGVPTLLGTLNMSPRGLAFDPVTGDSWVSDWLGNIYTVDLDSVKLKKVGETSISFSTPDICFDQYGNLYGTAGGGVLANNLISIDRHNGNGTPIGSIGFASVSGMATYLDTVWMVKPQTLSINNYMPIPGVDTLHIQTRIDNPNNHILTVNALLKNHNNFVTDTLILHDDGEHNDSSAGDNIFGNIWPVKSSQGFYKISILAYPTESGYLNNYIHDFTPIVTGGPVSYDHYIITSEDSIVNPGDRLDFKILLKNESDTDSLVNIEATLTSLDTCASVRGFDRYYGDIAPGEIVEPNRRISISFEELCNAGTTNDFALDIFSDGYHFWSDTFSVVTVTGLQDLKSQYPIVFALGQNYPNPFNPSTTIEYQLPYSSEVTLSIYNLLGQKVQTLISQKHTAGIYQIIWDASGFASGIYYYRLEAKPQFKQERPFIQTQKLILLK